MKYKYCLLAAGIGSRNSLSFSAHKGLLPVNNRTVISSLLDCLDISVPLVIAIGHNSHLLEEYFSIVHPQWNITFVNIDKYTGPGSGPGYSLQACKNLLQCPFVLLNCDSYIQQPVPVPDSNWMGCGGVNDYESYCLLGVINGQVNHIFDKCSYSHLKKTSYSPESLLDHAFTGIAGIHDYECFWEALESEPPKKAEEKQVSIGFMGLLQKGLEAQIFNPWFDIGTDDSYQDALDRLGTDQVLLKPDEFIYFEKNQVIKFFSNSTTVSQRIYRANRLKGIVPKIKQSSSHFYSYEYVPGKLLSEITDVSQFREFLNFGEQNLFRRINLQLEEKDVFRKLCYQFYHDKTIERIELFYKTRNVEDKEDLINGLWTPKIETLLNKLDWNWLSEGINNAFHGDFQPENIICGKQNFILIDWRQNFNEELEYGDLYYDFAKLHHALIINGEVIRKGLFHIDLQSGEVRYEYHIKSNLLEFLNIFENYLENHGYELRKVKILSALIYLNIAPLHFSPYSELLYFLGKRTLYQLINE